MLTRFAQIYNLNTIEALSLISKYYGIRLDLVQAGGGNISIKESNCLYIKASGHSFFDVGEKDSLSVVRDIDLIAEDICKNISNEAKYLRQMSDYGQPSLETFMHCMTKKITVHLHPIAVIDCLGSVRTTEILLNNFDSGFVKYTKPGKKLAMAIKKEFPNKLPNVIFLENHGMIVHGDTPEEVFPIIDEVVKYSSVLSGYDFSLYEKCSEVQQIIYSSLNKVMYIIPTKYTINRETPDCIVYCGVEIPIITGKNTFSKLNHIPPIINYKNHLFIIGKNYLKCKQIEDVAYMHSLLKNVSSLSQKEINEILEWDSEKLRNNL